MNKILTLLGLLISVGVLAQTQGISYQAVLIDENTQEIPGIDVTGSIFPNKELALKFSILNDVGVLEYQEVHLTSTDAYGMINVIIGQGEPSAVSSGLFSDIDWNGSPKDLKVELSLEPNGSTFEDFSFQPLHFVPYAFHRNITATGTMKIDGVTDLNNALNVTGSSPTNLTGTLAVDGVTNLNSDLNILGGGSSYLSGSLTVDGLSVFSNVDVSGIISITNTTPSTATTNGALLVAGGVGIAKEINLGGTLTTAGVATINNTLNVNGSSSYIANFVNTTNANGISIRVGAATPANANNFVTFINNGGATVGRIEGETITELATNDDYLLDKNSLDLAVTIATIDVTTAAVAVIIATGDLAAASSSSTACAGIGACLTAPIPSLIVVAIVNLAAEIANAIAVAVGLDDAITYRDAWVTNASANVGVTYQSGSGDYAEWLPKANLTEKLLPGYIVGIKNGHISLQTKGADKLFAISTKPIVLGNMPEAGKEVEFEKVAFMGQIPIHVIGKVNAGDYIVPSGFNNGFGKAIAPDKMTPDDYAHMVGMAWSSSTNDIHNLINVAIGLNTGDISKIVADQNKEINELKQMLSETQEILSALLPGYNELAGITDHSKNVNTKSTSSQNQVNYITPDESNIIYFKVTKAQIQEGLNLAQQIFIDAEGDINIHPFWKQIKNDVAYKELFLNQIEVKLEHAIHTHKEINKKF